MMAVSAIARGLEAGPRFSPARSSSASRRRPTSGGGASQPPPPENRDSAKVVLISRPRTPASAMSFPQQAEDEGHRLRSYFLEAGQLLDAECRSRHHVPERPLPFGRQSFRPSVE